MAEKQQLNTTKHPGSFQYKCLISLDKNVLTAHAMPPFHSFTQRDHFGSGNGELFIVQKIRLSPVGQQQQNKKLEKYTPGKPSMGLFLPRPAEVLLHTGFQHFTKKFTDKMLQKKKKKKHTVSQKCTAIQKVGIVFHESNIVSVQKNSNYTTKYIFTQCLYLQEAFITEAKVSTRVQRRSSGVRTAPECRREYG